VAGVVFGVWPEADVPDGDEAGIAVAACGVPGLARLLRRGGEGVGAAGAEDPADAVLRHPAVRGG
jgi:hypothetical protein